MSVGLEMVSPVARADPVRGALERIGIAYRGIVAFPPESATPRTIGRQIALRRAILREIETVRLHLRRSRAGDGVWAANSHRRRALRSNR